MDPETNGSENTVNNNNDQNQNNANANADANANANLGTGEDVNNGQQNQNNNNSANGNRVDSIPYGRFKEVNDERQTFKTANEQLTAENEQFKQALQSLTGGGNQENVNIEGPTEDQFNTREEFIDARYAWNQKKIKEANDLAAQQTAHNTDVQNYTKSMQEARGKYADFDQKVNACTVDFSKNPAVEKQILKAGGDLAYVLASDPVEAQRIVNLPKDQALIALGTISTRIPRSNGQPNNASGMPNPIEPIGGGQQNGNSGTHDADLSQEDFQKKYPLVY